MKSAKFAAALFTAAVLAAGCGEAGSDEGSRTLTVFAAASLTETFGELEKAFEAEHDGVDVRLSFGGSSRLAEQIVEGAPADVFAAADEKAMTTVTDAKLADGKPRLFATNALTIAVEPGNPEGIKGLADLQGGELIVVTCAPEVPCGRAAGVLADRAGVTLNPASEEPDVKSVLGKVVAGEADAGLVYVTDVTSAGEKVDGVEIAEAAAEPNRYPIAALRESGQPELAGQFTEFVLSESGRRVLRDAGFGGP
ncbi:MAG: molybdate ABC transporter substrate-binding protein [Thermocrispum sp.]